MALLNTILYNIIIENKNYCCLCLKSGHSNYLNNFYDEVILNCGKSVNLINLVTSVLDKQIQDIANTLQSICKKCTEALIISYKFINMCKETSKQIYTALETVKNSLESENDFRNQKYICIDTDFNIIEEYNIDNVLSDIDGSTITQHILQKVPTNSVLNSKLQEDNSLTINSTEKKKIIINNNKFVMKNLQSSTNCICDICNQTYASAIGVRRHYFRAHAPKEFTCSKCPKQFGSKFLLEQHINNSHRKVICSKCGKVYNSSWSLEQHVRSHYSRHVCHNCGKVYKSKISFKSHVNSSCGQARHLTAEQKFTCDYCSKQYSHKGSLRVHIQFEHGNWKCHICYCCGKKLNSLSKLKEHIVTHTQEKKFNCEICNGNFVTKKSLEYHTRIHTGVKPYKCPHCNKSFLSASRRSTHIKYKHMPAKEECEICNKKFKMKISLMRHKKRHFVQNSN